MVDVAGYKIYGLIRPKCALGGKDRGSEKSSPVFEHPYHKTMAANVSLFEWSRYPAGREIDPP